MTILTISAEADFDNHPCHKAIGVIVLPAIFRDLDIYLALLGDYELRLNLLDASVTKSGGPEVFLGFAVTKDAPTYASLMKKFSREVAEYNAALRDDLLERERAGALRGIR